MAEDIKLGALRRDSAGAIEVRMKTADEGPTSLTLSASSGEPYERWFGTEVLSHERKAIRWDRFDRQAVPLLFNHNWDDPIGMVTGARVEGGRLMVDANLFATERARDIETMVDGGLRNVSIGYQVHEFVEDAKKGIFTATDWEPLEISIVTVPADPTVGVGREAEKEARPVRVVREVQPAAAAASTGATMATAENAPAGASADIQVIENGLSPVQMEKQRAGAIRKFCSANELDERYGEHWIRNGTAWDQIADEIIEIRKQRADSKPQSAAHLGMTQSEAGQFSIARAISACATKNWSKAGLEAEASKAVAQRLGKMAGEHTFFVPLDVQMLQRDLAAGTGSVGGLLVGTTVMSFIELLRNRSVVTRLGATMMSGLSSNVAIPRQITAATGHWMANEQGTATESQPTINQLTLSPKTVGGYTEISRQLLLQTGGQAESIVNADLAAVIGLAVDAAALSGPGTAGQPTGITATAGLGTANPTTGTNVGYADMIRFQTAVANANAMFPGFGYVTTPAVAGILMGKPRFTNSDTPIWGGMLLDGQVVGARAMASLQIGSGSMLAGDFSNVIIAEWGALEIEVNPYAQFQSGIIGVRALYTCDVGVRYGASFALGTGMTA
jgi:HK97 family phage major capsid protein/HK97 family phage prohead protease